MNFYLVFLSYKWFQCRQYYKNKKIQNFAAFLELKGFMRWCWCNYSCRRLSGAVNLILTSYFILGIDFTLFFLLFFFYLQHSSFMHLIFPFIMWRVVLWCHTSKDKQNREFMDEKKSLGCICTNITAWIPTLPSLLVFFFFWGKSLPFLLSLLLAKTHIWEHLRHLLFFIFSPCRIWAKDLKSPPHTPWGLASYLIHFGPLLIDEPRGGCVRSWPLK